MIQTVANLTPQSVIGEIDSILDTYPYQPYQQAFAIPDLRQELINYVLNSIPYLCNTIEWEKVASVNYQSPRTGVEQKVHLEQIIHQGIYSILQEKSEWISRHLPEKVQPGFEPSHWFG